MACLIALATVALSWGSPPPPAMLTLQARVIATGLHSAQGIRQVGRFHSGGPLTSNPEFLLQTQAGHVLDAERVLVTSADNFGAKPADPAQSTGTVLSIDPRVATTNGALEVPFDLALRPRLAGAAVQIYSAQSDRYLNRRHNGSARTARFGAVAGPRYLSINNAFGRPWIANAPFGIAGEGSESVVDPDGAPLANAPSEVAGGVFVGDATARRSVPTAVRSGWLAMLWNHRDSAQLTPGAIDHGALGTALLGASPDGSGFAVFAVVTGTGAVVQVHVQDGVDGLAPAGTIDVGNDDPGLIGVAFKWSPQRVLYVADARRNRLVLMVLGDDARHFKLDGVRHIDSPWLRQPVDLAAAVPEIANPRFASHTSLAGSSDLYVMNRGDGSVLRLAQDGSVVARAVIDAAEFGVIGGGRLRSIAVSADAKRLWLIAQQPGSDECVLLEVSGFDAAGAFASPSSLAVRQARPGVPSTGPAVKPIDEVAAGARLFTMAFTAETGLGSRFNADSCLACHPGPGGASAAEQHVARRIARMDASTGRILPIDGEPSAFAPRLSTPAPGEREAPATTLPRDANVVSLRTPLTLFAAARLDEIPDAVIEAQAVSKGDGIKGRVHYVRAADGTRGVGRYGWKADIATLEAMVAGAFVHEMGFANALAAQPTVSAKDGGAMVRSVSAYLRGLRDGDEAIPLPVKAAQVSR